MGGKSGQDRFDVREVVRDAGLSRSDWPGENLLPNSGSAPFCSTPGLLAHVA